MKTPQIFVKKPVTVEAIQWSGSNYESINKFVSNAGKKCYRNPNGSKIFIPTLEGTMEASKGDWIIKGIKGEVYPCKPDIFEDTYSVQQ